MLAATVVLLAGLISPLTVDDKSATQTPREALRTFNELIGPWKASGEPETGSTQEKQRGLWKESVSWGWKFKGDDAWLVLEIKNGKHFRGGELRYLPDKSLFQLTMQGKDGKPLVFEGKMSPNGRSLIAERIDEDKKETQRLTINLVGDVRFVYRLEHRPEGRKQFMKDFMVAATKEGESLAATAKSDKPECIVSGGLGTIRVTYKGESYWVCCSGCRDAFNENPEKYIKEAAEKKAKGND